VLIARAVVGLISAAAFVVSSTPSAFGQTVDETANTAGRAEAELVTAQASYKRQVESVEFGTRELAGQLTSAAESQAGSPAVGGSDAQARSSVSTLPGCYNHIVASDDGTLRYGHICPGYGGHLGGRTSELFGIGEIVMRDPVTGEITDVVPVDELSGGAAPTITVSSALLAQFALADLVLPSPIIGMSPEGDHVTQLPSWLWIDRGQWQSRDRTASAGPVSATVTASPLRVEWNMGNGDTVTCDGPGRVYEARFAGRPEATDCRYTYRHSSAVRRGAAYDVTATVVWRARWSGSDGDSGGLGELTSQTTVPVRVGEVQALVQ
jgi:hypothetical protein